MKQLHVRSILPFVSILFAAACGGATPAPVEALPATDAPSAAPSAAPSTTAAAEAPAAPSAVASAAPAAPAADASWPGLTGEDLDWAKKCAEGEGVYCMGTGNKYEFVRKDMENAYKAYKLGCEATKQKEAGACMNQGRLMIAGQGTPANVDKGVEIWTAACNDGKDSNVCSMLGKAYEKGDGVKKDAAKAKEFFGNACDRNLVSDCKKGGKKPPTN
jgi:TPR repeat protein